MKNLFTRSRHGGLLVLALILAILPLFLTNAFYYDVAIRIALNAIVVIVLVLGWFFGRTLMGKAMLATSHNKLAAQLVGINTRKVLLFSFGLSALLGAAGGILVAPITYTSYDAGIMLGLKGFVAAVLGGLGGGAGAIAGGLILGIAEAMTAGYISSAYKDAVPFVLILLILFFLPQGLFGAKNSERV